MKFKNIIVGIGISLIVISSLLAFTGRPIWAQEEAGYDQEITKRLDDIVKTQKEILDSIASMKEELKIIKIRITQAQ